MTIGEKLQQLRKERQMSQEELGNLLLVSRQTISLWENNQTVPTVDNLIRLKEIFGVSVDSILTDEKTENSETVELQTNDIIATECCEPPIEKLCFSFEKKDLKYIYKISVEPLFKRLLLWISLLFFSVFNIILDTSEEKSPYFLFYFSIVFLLITLIQYTKFLLMTKANAEVVCNRKYKYEIFHDYLVVRIFAFDEEIRTQKICFNEIKRCWETPFCYFIEYKDGTRFVIKKSSLEENSTLRYVCHNLKTQKTDYSSEKNVFLKTLGEVLFIGSFISFFIALTISVNVFSQETEMLRDGLDSLRWFHYLLPIPVASVVTGILLNKNKVRNKKNVVCGIIIGLLMLIYGFFPSIYADDANSRLGSIEAQLGFEFPPSVEMDYNVEYGVSGAYQMITTLSFEESVANDFETFMKEDSRWLTGENDTFKSAIPEGLEDFSTDYFLIYNTETNEFGKLPEGDSECEYIYVAYDAEMNVVYICQYHCGID